MLIAILFWLVVVILAGLYINKWHKYDEPQLKFWHNVILGLAALGTLSLIVKVIFK